jgi:hypothetical protein
LNPIRSVRTRAVLLAIVMALAGLAAASAARANPMPLPYTYVYSTLPKGEAEIEQYADLTPVKAVNASSGDRVTYLASQFQTEFEYGITDHLELGLYLAFQPYPTGLEQTATLTEGTGAKERLRYRFAEEGELPIDLAIYGEVVEFDSELEFEGKILLQKRFGDLILAANLWGEVEQEYADAVGSVGWVANPTLGATYQVTPVVHLGLEGWMRAEWPGGNPARVFALGPHEFVGPTFMFNFGRLWWSTGAYLRVDELDHPMAPLDNYGPVWIRTIIGFGL